MNDNDKTKEQLLQELQETREQLKNKLRVSEEQYRSYFETAMVGLVITSPEKGWVEMNNRICTILGYSKDELMEMTWVELTHPDDLEIDVAHFERLMAGEIPEYSIKKRFIHKNGTVIHTIISVTTRRAEDGSIQDFVALLQDVTAHKKIETEREHLQQEVIEVQQQAKARVDILYAISHDLNAASNEDEILRVLARLATETDASGASLQYIELDSDGEPEWLTIAASWQREGELPAPIGTRFYLPEFPSSKLWLSNPDEPMLVADVTTDERVDETSRDLLTPHAHCRFSCHALSPSRALGRNSDL